MAAKEFRFAKLAQQSLGPNAQVAVLLDEKPELVGQVQVGLVVGRSGKQHAPAVILPDILLDGPIAFALAVAEIVALVQDDEPEAAELGQLLRDPAQGQDPPVKPVVVSV